MTDADLTTAAVGALNAVVDLRNDRDRLLARVAQLETAGQQLADALKHTAPWWPEDGPWEHTAGRLRHVLAAWDAVTVAVPPRQPPPTRSQRERLGGR